MRHPPLKTPPRSPLSLAHRKSCGNDSARWHSGRPLPFRHGWKPPAAVPSHPARQSKSPLRKIPLCPCGRRSASLSSFHTPESRHPPETGCAPSGCNSRYHSHRCRPPLPESRLQTSIAVSLPHRRYSAAAQPAPVRHPVLPFPSGYIRRRRRHQTAVHFPPSPPAQLPPQSSGCCGHIPNKNPLSPCRWIPHTPPARQH